ncbi:MAG: hypothetical protein JW682_00475 [Campylobacterales bacterium]|nr:hypothetical protein [Campylobacterales bacterium]HEO97879.1 hypothetical protein [Campylobacterota bacterium]
MKKALVWGTLLILLDIAVGAIAIEYFDLITFAQKYNREIVHGTLILGIGWVVVRKYRKLRFKERTGQVTIQFLEK